MDSDNWIKTNAQKLKYYVGYFLDATPSKAAEAEHYVKRDQNKSALRPEVLLVFWLCSL